MVHSFPTRRSSDLLRCIYTFLQLATSVEKKFLQLVRSEEHTSELQSHHPISYAVFCLKKKNITKRDPQRPTSVHHSKSPCTSPASFRVFFFNATAPTEIYTGWYTLSLHDALPI